MGRRSRLVVVVAGALLVTGLPVLAGAECAGDHALRTAGSGQDTVGPAGATASTADRTTLVISGAPGQSVEVRAPSSVAATAVGGDGPAGQPGASAR